MSRPDEKILKNIQGYTMKKGREKGTVFLMSPMGSCFTLPIEVIKEIHNAIETDSEIRSILKLSKEN